VIDSSKLSRLSAVAIALAFVARLPAIVAPFGPDQGVYVTIGWGLSRGLTLYRDMFELKPPGIYVTYWAGMHVFGSGAAAEFWLDFVAAAVTVLAIIAIVRRLASPGLAMLAGAVVSVGTLPAARYAYGGFLERSVTETFSIPILACAIWAATVSSDRDRPLWPLLSGLLIGLAAIYKQSAVIYWPALIVWIGWTAGVARARRFALWSLPAIFAAPVIAFVWIWWTGALDWAWNALVRYIAAYLSIGHQGLLTRLHYFAQEVWRRQRADEVWGIGSVASVFALIPALRARTSASGRLASLGVVWLAAALLAVFINGPRLFTTYFVPPQIPLCLLAAWLLHEVIAIQPRWKLLAGTAVLALTAFLFVQSGSIARAAQSISWDWQYISGRVDRMTYLDRFPPKKADGSRGFSAADNQRLADYVSAHTDPAERIFVFGMVGGTYYSSQRLPANRFLFAYPAVSNMGNYPEFRAETLAADLSRAQPRYIILQRSNGDAFSGWRASEAFKAPPIVALLDRYRAETEIGDFVLYRRLD
jgi:hypothetical protein